MSMQDHSIFLYRLHFFLQRLTAWYCILVEAIVKGVVSLISSYFSVHLSFVHRRVINYCEFICLQFLLNVFISCRSSPLKPSGLLMYAVISSANQDTSAFPICIPSIFFSCLNALDKLQVLWRYGVGMERACQPCLFLYFSVIALSSLHLRWCCLWACIIYCLYYVAVCLFFISLISLGLLFWRNVECCQRSWQWDDPVAFVFHFVHMVDYI